jgi:hypothetical protein
MNVYSPHSVKTLLLSPYIAALAPGLYALAGMNSKGLETETLAKYYSFGGNFL